MSLVLVPQCVPRSAVNRAQFSSMVQIMFVAMRRAELKSVTPSFLSANTFAGQCKDSHVYRLRVFFQERVAPKYPVSPGEAHINHGMFSRKFHVG